MPLDLDKPQVLELLNDTCERCREAWPVKWTEREKVWRHERQNAGSTSIVICLATRLREKYAGVLNG